MTYLGHHVLLMELSGQLPTVSFVKDTIWVPPWVLDGL